MFIGCHVSIAKGIFEAPKRAADLGCECMQIFTRSPQGGKAPELTKEVVEKFKSQIKECGIKSTVVHTPYYINFASANNRILHGSINVVRDELERASLIGAEYVMTHLGTAKDLDKKEALKKTAEMLSKSLEGYSGKTKLLLENSAGAGEIIGDDLKELGNIIKKTKSNAIAGICLDTQHSFASGYDWNDFENTLKKIDKELGLKNIKLFHINNSETELGSKKDRHAHLDSGKINLEAFEKIVKFAKKNKINLILETKHDQVEEDIKILKDFRK